MLSFFEKSFTAIRAEACRFIGNCPSRGPEKKTFIIYNPKIIKSIIRDNIKNALSHTVSASHSKDLILAKKITATARIAARTVISSILG